MNKIVKKIVNNKYSCDKCEDSKFCIFMNGVDRPKNFTFCDADAFAEGIHATLKYLNKLPWDVAVNEIGEYNTEQQENG